MKTKIKQFSRRSLATLLSVMMVISTVLVGTVSVNAATTNKFTPGEVIYFNPAGFTGSNGDNWASSTPLFKAAFYYYNTGTKYGEVDITLDSGSTYKFTVPNNDYLGYVKIKRYNATDTSTLWNESQQLSVDDKDTKNCITITGWDNSASWTTYTPPLAFKSTATAEGEITGVTKDTSKSINIEATSSSSGSINYTFACKSSNFANVTITGDNTATPSFTISEYGTYIFTATATQGSNSIKRTYTVNVADPSQKVFTLYKYTDIGSGDSQKDLSPDTYQSKNSYAHLDKYESSSADTSDYSADWYKGSNFYSLKVSSGTDRGQASYENYFNIYNSTDDTWIYKDIKNLDDISINGGNSDHDHSQWNKLFMLKEKDFDYYINYYPNENKVTITKKRPMNERDDQYNIKIVSDNHGSTELYFKTKDSDPAVYDKTLASLASDANSYPDNCKVKTKEYKVLKTQTVGSGIENTFVLKTTVSSPEIVAGYSVDKFIVNGTKYAVATTTDGTSGAKIYTSVPIDVTDDLDITVHYINKYKKVYATVGIGKGTTKVYTYDEENDTVGSQIKTNNNHDYTEDLSTEDYFKVEIGKYIVVKTTITDTDYYVDNFVVNGIAYSATPQEGSTNVYVSAPIEITGDTEITPVYYLKNGNYITVYVQASDGVLKDWGNTISAYAWDTNPNPLNDDDKHHPAGGNYPGQPFGKTSSGLYVGKILKTNTHTDTGAHPVTGVTFANFAENNDLHKSFLTSEQQHNLQTYDYDDYKILSEMGFDSVKVELKYYDGNGDIGHYDAKAIEDDTHAKSYKITNTYDFAGGNSTDNKGFEAKHDIPSGESYTNAKNAKNPYEELYNFDGNAISVIGLTSQNIKDAELNGLTALKLKDGSNLLGALNPDNAAIKIVSVGNQKTKSEDTFQADWATVWYVFDTVNNKLITKGYPSDFIPRGTVSDDGVFTISADTAQTVAYNDIKKHKINNISAAYYAAAISYESEQNAYYSGRKDNQTGIRMDARWLYATSNDKFPAKVQIMYADGSVDDLYNNDGTLNSTVANSKDTWTKDTYTGDSVTGNVTNASASMEYTDKNSDVQGPEREFAEVNRNTKVSVVTSTAPKASYKFIGWYKPVYEKYVESDELKYRLTGYEPADKSKQVDYTIGGDLELYAMYVPVAGLYVKSGIYSPKTATELDSNNWILEGVESDKKTGTTTGAEVYATFKGINAREFVEDESDANAFKPGSTVALNADNSVPETGLTNGKRYEFAGWYKLNAETKEYERFSSSTNYDSLKTNENEKTTTVYALYKVKTNVKAMVEYSTNGTTFTPDTSGDVATATIEGGTATANNTYTKTNVVVDQDSVTVSNSSSNANYKFDGWYIKKGNTYTKVNTTTIKVKSDDVTDDVTSEGVVIVARYVPADKVKVDVKIAYKDSKSADWTTTSIPTTLTAKVDGADSKIINAGDGILGNKFAAGSSSDDYVFLGWYYANDTLDTKLLASSTNIKDSVENSAFSNLTANKTAYALFVKAPTLTFKHSTDEIAKAQSLLISNLSIKDSGTVKLTYFPTGNVSTFTLPKDTTEFKDVVKGIYKGTDYTFTVDVKASANSGSYVGNTTYGSSDNVVVTRDANTSTDTEWKTTSSIDLDKSGTNKTYTLKTSFSVTLKVIAMTDENNGKGYEEGQVNKYGVTSSQTLNGSTNSNSATTTLELVKKSTPTVESTLTNNTNGYYEFIGFFDNVDDKGTRLDNTTPGTYTVPAMSGDVTVYALYKAVQVNVTVLNKLSTDNGSTYEITSSQVPGSTQSVNGTPAYGTPVAVNKGSQANLTQELNASASTKYEFVGFGNASSVINNYKPTITDVTTVYAYYKVKQTELNVKVAYKDSTSATNWTVGTPFGVSAKVDGSTSKTVNVGDTVEANKFTHSEDNNYAFVGWYYADSSASTSLTISDGDIKSEMENFTIGATSKDVYALYIKQVDVNVKVAYKDSTSASTWTVGNPTNINAYIDTDKTTAKVNAGSEVAGSRFSKNSSNDNYTFVGWYYADSSASTSLTISDGNIKSEMEDFTIATTSKDVYALYKLNKPTSGIVEVTFKYYQRKIPNNTPADIESKATEYKVNISIDSTTSYSKFLETASGSFDITSVTDTYTMITDFDKINNFHNTQYNKEQTSGEKWVTFTAGSTSVNVDSDKENDSILNDGITKATIWLGNKAREYTVTMVIPTDGTLVGSGDKKYGLKQYSYTAYYNQRLGIKIGDGSGADNATDYLKGYGIGAYNGEDLTVPQEKVDDYKFVYWATDTEGKNIVSTDLHYYYRVTNNITLYAIYSKGKTPKGVSISAATTDTFVASNCTNKTRINDVVAVYGVADDTANATYKGISNIGVVYVKVNDVDTADAEVIHDYIKNNKNLFIKDNETVNIDGTKGSFVYYYKVNGTTYTPVDEAYEQGITLTNKNRIQLSFTSSTAMFGGINSYSNMLVFAIAKIDGEYYVSDSYVAYKNGEPTDKTV